MERDDPAAMDKKRLFRYCFGVSAVRVPAKAVVTPFPGLSRLRRRADNAEDISGRLYRGFLTRPETRGMIVVSCGVGAGLLGDAVLLLAAAGVREILFIGTCGGLNGCRAGDIILCGRAYNGEGFSVYHAGDPAPEKIMNSRSASEADGELSEKVLSAAEKIAGAFTVRRGDIFTTGSLLAETPKMLRLIERKGFLGIDMEMSAVFTAAALAGIRAAGCAVVSDLPLEKPFWEALPPGDKKRFDESFDKLADIATEFESL